MKKGEKNVRVNLTLTKEFSNLLTQNAERDYMPTATWVKQFLMKHLLHQGDNKKVKNMDLNGTNM